MTYKIRLAKPSDLKEYTNLLQTTYEFSYTNPKIGLTKECFSKEVFNTVNTQDYLKTKVINSSTQKTWLVFDIKKLIASATCKIIDENKAEFSGFYVLPSYQHQGLGKILYQKVLKFSGDRNLILGIYTHNTKTIKIYKKWGWKIDPSRGENGYVTGHWIEWPDGVVAKSVYLILKENRYIDFSLFKWRCPAAAGQRSFKSPTLSRERLGEGFVLNPRLVKEGD
jgi:RimJ/RimL family protein N-acetyltransferase